MKKVCVIGLGYIGLPTAAILASKGFDVSGVDINKEVVKSVNKHKSHISEPGLDKLLKQVVSTEKLHATNKIITADVFIITVPTPLKENLQPNISFVEDAVKQIALKINNGNLILLESTCPVGTTEQIVELLRQERPDLSLPGDKDSASVVSIAYCPERVIPGKTLVEIVQNDRVIGGYTESCAKIAHTFYKSFVLGKCFITNARTAEMAKLTENAFRDVNIAFANEISMLCDDLDVDTRELIELANRHPRVNILSPGPGVGGHCIAVDPYFLISQCKDNSILMQAARQVNQKKVDWVMNKVKTYSEKFTLSSNFTIACFGLAFKADVDDLRESPALEIAKRINSEISCNLLLVEPNLICLPSDTGLKIELSDLSYAISSADLLVLLVDHKEFKLLKPSYFNNKSILDTRGIWKLDDE